MTKMHLLTLGFYDSATEAAFVRHILPRLRLQGRAAIILGVVVDFLYGAVDHLFVPADLLDRVWLVLCRIARRLESAMRETDTISRIGGDEFFVLVQDIGSCDGAAHLAEKLIAVIEQPIPELPGRHELSASIGICLFPRAGLENTPDSIIRSADLAMYLAKADGKRCHRFAEMAV